MTRILRFRPTPLRNDASGAAAVEFALLVPILLLLMFGIMGFGWILGIAHSLQEVASQSARASVAGLDPGERSTAAIATAKRRTTDNPLIRPDALTVEAATDAANPDIFTVTVRYDLSTSVLKAIPAFVPLPTSLTRTASIRRGGL